MKRTFVRTKASTSPDDNVSTKILDDQSIMAHITITSEIVD